MSQRNDDSSDSIDNPLTECPNCGATVLRDYIQDDQCPDCRDGNGDD